MVIEGAAGRAGAPPATARSVPSLETEIERGWFFDSTIGELLNASVTRAGREPLKVSDRVIEATRHEVAGDLEQHVWCDANDAWVQWRIVAAGHRDHPARE